MPPKADPGKVLENVVGLPPGWQAVEKTYATGCAIGKTYTRYHNDKHNNVLSVKKAIELDAEDNGYDAAEALQQYEELKASAARARKEKGAAKREEKGLLEGERKKRCVDEFRKRYGPLNGATVCRLPGWRGESKLLERCKQIVARYISPEGNVYTLINQIEALFGNRLLNGEEIPDIEAARAGVVTNEKGKVINTARQEENVLAEFTGDTAPKAKRKKVTEVRVAKEDEFRASKNVNLVAMLVPTAITELEAYFVPEPVQVETDAADIHTLLLARGYPPDTSLLYLTGSNGRKVINKRLVDAVNGFYFSQTFLYEGRPCYQQVTLSASRDALVCSGFYISWSSYLQVWKAGNLDNGKAGLAICRQDIYHPIDLEGPWMLYEPNVVEKADDVAEVDGTAAGG